MSEPDNVAVLVHSKDLQMWITHVRQFVIDQLKDDEDLVAFAVLRDGTQIRIDAVQSTEPNLVFVSGICEGEKVIAVLLQSSLQILMRVVKKEPNQPRRELGFALPKM